MQPSSWRRPLLAAAALVAVSTLAACQPVVVSYAERPGGPRIAVLGDSLIWAAQQRTQAELAVGGWSPWVSGEPGDAVAPQLDEAAAVMATQPHAVVVALGSNDVRLIGEGLQSWGGLRTDVRRMLGTLSGVPCIVWVGVSDFNGYFSPSGDLSTMGWAVNWIVAEELARLGRPAGTVVHADWAAVSRRLDYHLAPGDVHHSPLGQASYARFIRDSVGRCSGAPIAGNVDAVTAAPGEVRVAGWAVDPDAPDAGVRLHVYVDGRFVGQSRAVRPRPDVGAAYPAWGSNHGFEGGWAAAPGRREVCVWAIAEHGPPAPNALLRCVGVNVPA